MLWHSPPSLFLFPLCPLFPSFFLLHSSFVLLPPQSLLCVLRTLPAHYLHITCTPFSSPFPKLVHKFIFVLRKTSRLTLVLKIYSILHCYLQVYQNAMQRLDEYSDTNGKAFGIGFPVLAFSFPFIFTFCSCCL